MFQRIHDRLSQAEYRLVTDCIEEKPYKIIRNCNNFHIYSLHHIQLRYAVLT